MLSVVKKCSFVVAILLGLFCVSQSFAATVCDINRDGVVNDADIKLVTNAALGIPIGGLNADVNSSGKVDALDVQMVINAKVASNTTSTSTIIESRGDFILKPYLASSSVAANTLGYAIIRPCYQIENMSDAEIRITGAKLRWGLNSTDRTVSYNRYGIIRLEQISAPPFNQVSFWPHSNSVKPITDVTTPAVALKVPKGQYSLIVMLVESTNSDKVLMSSQMLFEVK